MVRVADFAQGKVLDANGDTVAGIKKVKATLPHPENAIDLGCRSEGQQVLGLVGIEASETSGGNAAHLSPARPPLPYSEVYFYEEAANQTVVTKLSPVAKQVIKENRTQPSPQSAATLPEVAASISENDEVYFGQPVIENRDPKRVFYWYCIQPKKEHNHQVFILACFDGKSTFAVDGYIAELPFTMRYWDGKGWVKGEEKPSWLYGSHLGVGIQPIVGVDAGGAVITYRPPDLMRIIDMPAN